MTHALRNPLGLNYGVCFLKEALLPVLGGAIRLGQASWQYDRQALSGPRK